jgi:hypothetical protein
VTTRFRTTRWVYDAAALRRERKALQVLAGMHSFLFETARVENGDMDVDLFAAIQLLDRLRKTVADEGTLAQATAYAHTITRKREEEVVR